MAALRIVLLTIVAAVSYGIAQDLVTAHLCVEYFSIGHPKVIESETPVALALVWGVLATWWFGLVGGLVLAWAARQGRWPKRSASDLARPIAVCLLVMAVGALLAGVVGRIAAKRGWVDLIGPIAERVPPDRHVPYLTNLWAHLAAYALGTIAVLALAWRVRRDRKRNASNAGLRPGA